jgi:hypothetical protein
MFQFCNVKDLDLIGTDLLDGDDYRLVFQTATRSLEPAVLNATTHVCIEGFHGQGACDCRDPATPVLPNAYSICVDHIGTDTDDDGIVDAHDCPDPSTLPFGPFTGVTKTVVLSEEECFCSASAFLCGSAQATSCAVELDAPCKSHQDCAGIPGAACKATSGGGPCHPGTVNVSVVDTGTTVTAGTGSCFVASSTGLTVTAISGPGRGICVSGDSNTANDPDLCDPTDGGEACTDCRDKVGADNVVCTNDDLLPRGDPATLPLVTGSAAGLVMDALETPGWCEGNTGLCTANVCVGGQMNGLACNSSDDCRLNCVEDINCRGRCSISNALCTDVADCPATETCDGEGAPCGGVLSLITQFQPAIATSGGDVISCDGYATSDLEGFQYGNGFGFVDSPGLGDGTTASAFACE